MKGETSNNIQKVIKISTDCDSDALLITVDNLNPFCHTGKALLFYTCIAIIHFKGKKNFLIKRY